MRIGSRGRGAATTFERMKTIEPSCSLYLKGQFSIFMKHLHGIFIEAAMRTPNAFLLCLWLFQLAPQGVRAQTVQSFPNAASMPAPSGALSPSVANLLRDTPMEPPFDNNKTRLSKQELSILTQNGYKLQADGT